MGKHLKKTLSTFLAIIMLVTCFSAALPTIAKAAANAAQWTELVNALSNSTVASKVTSSNVTGDNGAVWRAAEALYNVVANEYSKGKDAANNATTRLNAYMKTQLSSRMGTAYTTYKVANVINFMLPTANIVDSGSKQTVEDKGFGSWPSWPCGKLSAAARTLTFTVSRTLESALLEYATADGIPANLNLTKTISYVHALEEVHSERKSGIGGVNKYRRCTKWNYLTNIARGDSASTATNKAALVNYNKHFSNALLASDLLALSDAQLDSIIANNNTNTSAVSGFSTAVRTKFLTNYSAAPAFMQKCINEKLARQYAPIVAYFQDAATGVINVAYDTNNLLAMKTLQAKALPYYTTLNSLNADTKALLVSRNGMNLAAIKAWLDLLEKNIQLCRLRQIKEAADLGINTTYVDYKDDSLVSNTLLQRAIGEFQGYVNELNGMASANIAEVFPNGTAYIPDFLTALKYESNKREIELTFSEYVSYFESFAAIDYAKKSSEAVIAAIDAALAKQKEYLAFYTAALPGLTDEDAEEVFNGYNAKIAKYIDNAFKVIEARFASEVQIGIDLYEEFGKITWQNFTTVKRAIGQIETVIYDRLVKTNYMTTKTRQDYARLLGLILNEYNNFIKNPPHAKTTLDLPVRKVRTEDFVRPDTAEKTYDYKVTNAKLDGVITKIDKILTDPAIGELLGLEGGLEIFVKDKIVKELFSDKTINEIIALFPKLTDVIPSLFDSVPSEFDTGVLGIKAKLRLSNGTTLYGMAEDLGLGVYPGLVAKNITNATNKQLLDSTGTMAYDDTWSKEIKHFLPNASKIGTKTNWYDSRFYDAETENFTFKWGITEIQLNPADYPNWNNLSDLQKAQMLYDKREAAFVNVLSEILKCIEPILQLLLLGRNHGPNVSPFIYVSAAGIINSDLGADVNFSALTLFKDVLVPIYEILGIEKIPVPSQTANTKTLVQAILNPLFDFVDDISTKPLRTVLEVMPNLSFSMILDKISPLISNISDININLKPTGGVSWLINLFAKLNFKLPVTDIIADTGVADMITESFGDLNTVLDFVVELLREDKTAAPINFPIINSGLIATLGTMKNRSSNGPAASRKYVEADVPQVFLYLLQYVFGALQDDEFAETLTELLGKGKSNSLTSILTELKNADNPDDAVAAVVELFYPVEYPMSEYEWIEPQSDRNFAYLKYKNNWTHEKAEAIAGNLEGIVSTITDLAGVDLEAEIDTLLGKFLTADTLKSLAKALADLGLDESISSLLKDIIGVDLSAWNDLENYAPTVNSADDFFNELCILLAPAAPLIALLLGDKDIVALDAVVLGGYDGYANGIIPLFEALGINGMMTPADYKAAVANDKSGVAALHGIIDPIKGFINTLAANPAGTLIDLVPSLLYFLETGGLSTALTNILQSALVILDTIRPIVDLQLSDILALIIGEEKVEGDPILDNVYALDTIDDITLGWILGLLYDATGLNLSRIVSNATKEMAYISKAYTSQNGKTYYKSAMTRADTITVLLSVIIELLYDEENRAVIADMVKDEKGILSAIIKVITDKTIDIDVINWFYFDPSIDPDDPFATWDGVTLPQHTIDYISYPNNWNEETAAYLDKNLDSIVNMIMGLVDPDGGSVSDLLAGSLDIYNDKTIESIIKRITDLTEDLDAAILELVGVALDIDLAVYKTMTWPTVTDKESFINALAIVLKPIEVLLDWILFEKDMTFFHGSEAGTGAENLITINGAKGYEYGLVPVLEALGIYNLKSYEELTAEGVTVEDKIVAIVGPVLDRLDTIIADPINEILALLPNLIYFLNADGLTVSANNLLGGVYNILDAIEPVAEVDLDEVFRFPVSDLSLANILDVVSKKTGINLDVVKKFLTQNGGLYIGEISSFNSANKDTAFKMTYSDAESRKDMITILFTLAFLTLDDANNSEKFKEMLPNGVFAAIKNILNLDNFKFEMQEIDWLYEVGDIKSAIKTSELFEYGYYRMWTKEKAQYVYDNFDDFLNNLIYLLGIEIEGISVKDLEDILNSLIGTNVYTTENINSIIKSIKDLIAKVDAIEGSAHIKELVKLSLGVDLNAWNAYNDKSFTFESGDRTAFVNALVELVSPLTPILGWLLTGDNFAFFVNEEKTDYVVLEGAQGYAYGIIPLLEAFGCERDSILTPAEFAADKDNMITNILNPILDKLDTVLADPLNGIFEMLPGLIYFINSKGLDASFKNILHPVYVVLNAIEPLVKVDLYEVLGFNLAEMDFNAIMDMVLKSIEESTGYALAPIVMDAIAELTTGKVVEFESKNGKMARTMIYASKADEVDMVTILLRVALKFVLMDENLEKIKAILKEELNMNDTSYKYTASLLDLFNDFAKSKYGMDSILGTLYYVAFGVYIATGEAKDSYDDLNKSWSTIFVLLKSIEAFAPFYDSLVNFLNKYLGGILDPDKVAPNGFVEFFRKISEFFQKIIDFFKGLFGG